MERAKGILYAALSSSTFGLAPLFTLLLLGLDKEANEARELIVTPLSFDQDIDVQNFEVTIRLLGGLLYFGGMLIMAWNVFQTINQSKATEATIPMPVHA